MALTLRRVAGLTVPEIPRAVLVRDPTMGPRAAREGRDQGGSHPLAAAGGVDDLPGRASGVLAASTS